MTLSIQQRRVRVFTKPAQAQAKQLERVRTQVDTFTKDGKLSAAEKKSLNASLAKSEKAARPLVGYQSEPVLELLGEVKRLARSGRLAAMADDVEGRLRGAGDRLVKQAEFAAAHDRLKKDGWKRAYHGVATKNFRYHGLAVHAVAVDLADPRVRLQTNTQGERGKTVETQAKGHRAEIAINGDFFSFGSYQPSGLTETNGKQWSGTQAGYEPSIAFTGRHAEMLGAYHRGEPGWADNVVSARPMILRDGKVGAEPDNMTEKTSRIGLGLSKSNRVLYLVAVEGRSGVKGLTAAELGKLMKRVGADDAMTMDGGGSAQMYQRGRGMVHRSTDPAGARAVANVLMVQSR